MSLPQTVGVIKDIMVHDYDVIIYIDGTKIIAKDKRGTIISSGTAGTDDATVIQAAIDSIAATGGEVILNSPVTNIQPTTSIIINTSKITLRATNGTIIKPAADINPILIACPDGESNNVRGKIIGCKIHDLSFDCYAYQTASQIKVTTGSWGMIKDLEIYNITMYNGTAGTMAGRYNGEYQCGATWRGIEFNMANADPASSYLIGAKVHHIYIDFAYEGLYIESNGSESWMNGAVFDSMYFNGCVRGINNHGAVSGCQFTNNTHQACNWELDITPANINVGTSTFTNNLHLLPENDPVLYTSAGDTVDPLVSNTTYYIKNRTPNTFQLSATPGGDPITLTNITGVTHAYFAGFAAHSRSDYGFKGVGYGGGGQYWAGNFVWDWPVRTIAAYHIANGAEDLTLITSQQLDDRTNYLVYEGTHTSCDVYYPGSQMNRYKHVVTCGPSGCDFTSLSAAYVALTGANYGGVPSATNRKAVYVYGAITEAASPAGVSLTSYVDIIGFDAVVNVPQIGVRWFTCGGNHDVLVQGVRFNVADTVNGYGFLYCTGAGPNTLFRDCSMVMTDGKSNAKNISISAGTNGPVFDNCHIESQANYTSCDAVYVYNSSTPVFRNCKIINSKTSTNTSRCVNIQNAAAPKFYGCEIGMTGSGSGTDNNAVSFSWGATPIIENCHIYTTGSATTNRGLYILGGGAARVVNCHIVGNAGSDGLTIADHAVAMASASIDDATNTFTASGHGFQNGDAVVYTVTSGTLSPLVTSTTYYVCNVTASTFQVEVSVGGGVIDFTKVSTPTATFTKTDHQSSLWSISNCTLETLAPTTRYALSCTTAQNGLHVYNCTLIGAASNVTSYDTFGTYATMTKVGDADTVDGSHASDFATSGHDHALTYLGISATAADSTEWNGKAMPANTHGVLHNDGAGTLSWVTEGGANLPADAVGYLYNNGAGTLSWATSPDGNAANYIIDVKEDYGAVGDGSTDDTTAINNAIAAAIVAKSPIYFPPGTYHCHSTLAEITGSVSITGMPGQSIIDFSELPDTLSYAIKINTTAGATANTIAPKTSIACGAITCEVATKPAWLVDGVYLKIYDRYYIDNVDTAQSVVNTDGDYKHGEIVRVKSVTGAGDPYTVTFDSAIVDTMGYLSTQTVTMRQISMVDGVILNGITIKGPATATTNVINAFDIYGVRHFRMKNSEVKDWRLGIGLDDCLDAYIDNTYFENIGPTAGGQIGYGISLVNACDNINVTGCEFRKNCRHHISAGGGGIGNRLAGWVKTVNIQGNFFATNDNSSIDTHAPFYGPFNVIGNRFDGCSTAMNVVNGRENVKDNTFSNCGTGIKCGGAHATVHHIENNLFEKCNYGVWVDSDRITIQGNTFRQCANSAVYASNSSVSMDYITVKSNTFNECTTAGTSYVIRLDGGASARFHYIDISDNTLTNSETNTAVQVQYGDYVSFRNNFEYLTDSNQFINCTRLTISGNQIHENDNYIFSLIDCDYVYIEKNYAKGYRAVNATMSVNNANDFIIRGNTFKCTDTSVVDVNYSAPKYYDNEGFLADVNAPYSTISYVDTEVAKVTYKLSNSILGTAQAVTTAAQVPASELSARTFVQFQADPDNTKDILITSDSGGANTLCQLSPGDFSPPYVLESTAMIHFYAKSSDGSSQNLHITEGK